MKEKKSCNGRRRAPGLMNRFAHARSFIGRHSASLMYLDIQRDGKRYTCCRPDLYDNRRGCQVCVVASNRNAPRCYFTGSTGAACLSKSLDLSFMFGVFRPRPRVHSINACFRLTSCQWHTTFANAEICPSCSTVFFRHTSLNGSHSPSHARR